MNKTNKIMYVFYFSLDFIICEVFDLFYHKMPKGGTRVATNSNIQYLKLK